MNCEHIRTIMHQIVADPNNTDSDMLGSPSGINRELEQLVIDHTESCTECRMYQQQMQQIELALTSLPLAEPPVDFSAFDWQELAQVDTDSHTVHEKQRLTKNRQAKWQIAAIALLAIGIIIPTTVLSLWILPDFIPFITRLISQGLTQAVEMFKNTVQWIVFGNALWRSSITLVRTHILEIVVIVGMSSSLLLYMLKNREMQTNM